MEPLNTINMDHGIRVEIHQDDDPENPIQIYDCEAHVSIFTGHDFGNDTRFETPQAFKDYCDAQAQKNDPVIMLPVYLYDHSGLTVSTGGFSDHWDSGQVGWAWITESEAKDQWGVEDRATIVDNIRGTVDLLDSFLRGNCYGYVIKDHEGDELISCWGFFGKPEGDVLDEAKSAARPYVQDAAQAHAAYLTRRAKCFAI